LKIKFGTALAQDNQDNEIVSIPGLRERANREISLKNLSYIIQARMEEIMDRVQHELRISGFESGLIGGIVLTGGGSQLKHILQLTEYITGLEARRGVPDEYLSASKVRGVDNPSYATGIGLIIKALEKYGNEQDTVLEAPINVENPIIVENEKPSKIEKTVALESEIEVEKPVNPKSLKGMVSSLTAKLAGWISDDIEDFETNVNNNKNK
jgi:cell division protein FtsA